MDIDSIDETYWRFSSGASEYRFMTKTLNSQEVSKTRLHMERSIRFNGGDGLAHPTDVVIQQVKDALTTYKDYGVISRHESCELVLFLSNGKAV